MRKLTLHYWYLAYNKVMPQTGHKITINEDGVDKEAYTVQFTNGALEELERLKIKLDAPDLDSVVRVAIGLLRRIEEQNTNGQSK